MARVSGAPIALGRFAPGPAWWLDLPRRTVQRTARQPRLRYISWPSIVAVPVAWQRAAWVGANQGGSARPDSSPRDKEGEHARGTRRATRIALIRPYNKVYKTVGTGP